MKSLYSPKASRHNRANFELEPKHLVPDVLLKNTPPDVEVVVAGHVFQAHRSILEHYSPVLKRKIHSWWRVVKSTESYYLRFSNEEIQTPFDLSYFIEIHLPSIGKEEFEILLKYMYTGQIKVSCNYYLKVYQAASQLEMRDVIEICLRLVDSNDEIRTFYYIYVASKKLGAVEPWRRSLRRLTQRFEEAICAEEFLLLEVDNVEELLSAQNIGARSELLVYLAALNWLDADYARRRQHAFRVLQCVRFSTMTMDQLKACFHPPFLSKVLDIPEVHTLLYKANCYIKAKSIGKESLFKSYENLKRNLAFEHLPMDLWKVDCSSETSNVSHVVDEEFFTLKSDLRKESETLIETEEENFKFEFSKRNPHSFTKNEESNKHTENPKGDLKDPQTGSFGGNGSENLDNEESLSSTPLSFLHGKCKELYEIVLKSNNSEKSQLQLYTEFVRRESLPLMNDSEEQPRVKRTEEELSLHFNEDTGEDADQDGQSKEIFRAVPIENLLTHSNTFEEARPKENPQQKNSEAASPLKRRVVFKEQPRENRSSSSSSSSSSSVEERVVQNAKTAEEERVGQNAKTAEERVGQNWKIAKERIGQNAKTVKERVGQNAKTAEEQVGQNWKIAIGRVGQNAKTAKERVGQNAKTAEEERVGQNAKTAEERVGQNWKIAKERIGQKAKTAEERVGQNAKAAEEHTRTAPQMSDSDGSRRSTTRDSGCGENEALKEVRQVATQSSLESLPEEKPSVTDTSCGTDSEIDIDDFGIEDENPQQLTEFEKIVRNKRILKQWRRRHSSGIFLAPENNDLPLKKTQIPNIFLVGGMNPTSLLNAGIGVGVLNYLPSKDKWMRYNTIPEARHNHSIVYYDQKLYVIGGCDPIETMRNNLNAAKNTCFRLHIDLQEWEEIRCMRFKRYDHAVALLDGYIFVVGGQDENERLLKSIEVYDTKKEKWKFLTAEMCCGRKAMGATSFKRKIWIAGGLTQLAKDINFEIVSHVDCYDPELKRWFFNVSLLPSPRVYHQLIVWNGSICCVGGMIHLGQGELRPTDEVWFYDAELNLWRSGPPLPVARMGPGVVVFDNTLYVVGGFNPEAELLTRHVNYLTSEGAKWKTAAPLPVQLFGCSAVSVQEE